MMSDAHNGKSDRDLLIEVHGMMQRLDERTVPLPGLVKQVERHEVEIKLLKRGGSALFAVAVTAGIVARVMGWA